MDVVAISEYGAVIGETVFAHGQDQIRMALFDHAALGFELQLSINGRFFFGQLFADATAASHAARQRCTEYEADGWVVQPFSDNHEFLLIPSRAVPTTVPAA